MSLGQIAHAIQDTQFFTALRESGLPYPIVLSSHLATLAVFGGLILVSDLRLLGLALTNIPASEVLLRTRVGKRVGFLLMITWGILLGGAKLGTYYDNPYFQVKVTLLVLVGVHAIVFRGPVYRNPKQLDGLAVMPRAAKAAAYTSLALWLGIMTMGRLIAYYDRPEMHPRRAPQSATPSSPSPGSPQK